MRPSTIPIVDLQRPGAAKSLHNAFLQTGFAYIVNHDIDEKLCRELHLVSQKFFAQSLDQKNKIAMRHAGRAWRGYFATGAELTAGVPDQKEGLYFGSEHDPKAAGVQQRWPMHGQNQWPEGSELQRLKPVVTRYMEMMTHLGHRLMSLVAVGLGLDADYFRTRFSEEPTTLFRIFNYPKQAADAQVWGVGAHTDMGFLTILLQDHLGGLQVLNRQREWMNAPPLEGSFIINIGDMLQLWTHGIYKATLHRVKNSSSQDRLSFPFFFDPHWQCNLQPIDPKLLSAEELLAAKVDADRQRWDGLDLSTLSVDATYGEFVWSKIKNVFPNLAEES